MESLKIYTSSPLLLAVHSLAAHLTTAAGKPVQILPLAEMTLPDPTQRKAAQLRAELLDLDKQVQAVAFFEAQGAQQPHKYAEDLRQCALDKARYTARRRVVEGELFLLTGEGGEQHV